MLTRSTWQALTTWAALLGLGHVFNVWIGVLGALIVNILFTTIRED